MLLCVRVHWAKKTTTKKPPLCSTNHEASFSPINHNKEQLNAAALPAEEPTAGRTSTNRQICIKPKGRSNKSQPTGNDPQPLKKKKTLLMIQTRRWLAAWLHPITQYRRSGPFKMCCLTCKSSAAVMCHYIVPFTRFPLSWVLSGVGVYPSSHQNQNPWTGQQSTTHTHTHTHNTHTEPDLAARCRLKSIWWACFQTGRKLGKCKSHLFVTNFILEGFGIMKTLRIELCCAQIFPGLCCFIGLFY